MGTTKKASQRKSVNDATAARPVGRLARRGQRAAPRPRSPSGSRPRRRRCRRRNPRCGSAARRCSSMMRLDSASVSVPCTPRPVWMRILRSCLAITKSTPSSTSLRPSFHASVTRVEKSSIGSPSRVGTSSTATCEPRACSKACSFASRASRCCAESVPVWSITRARELGDRRWVRPARRTRAAPGRARRPRPRGGGRRSRVMVTGPAPKAPASARNRPSAARRSPSRSRP